MSIVTYTRKGDVWQLIVPMTLRQKIIGQSHAGLDGGHPGPRKTKLKVQRRAYWVGWANDVELYCKGCLRCQLRARGKAPKQGLLTDFRVGAPMERWGLDITGPHPVSSGGFKYIVTAIDYFTRWAEAYPIRNQEAATVATVLAENIVCKFGLPLQILSDQGPNFESALFQRFCQIMGVDKIRTTPYQPRTNGLIERFHRTLNGILGKVVEDNQKDWCRRLPFVMAAYRATPHEVTRFTPNFLFLGRENYAPIDLALGFEVPETPGTVDDRVTEIAQTMAYAYDLVRNYSGIAVQRRKRRYDMRVRPKEFQVDEWVLYFYPRRRPGKSPKWGHGYVGPCLVVGVINDLSYWIQKSARSLPEVVHVDKLKKFVGEPPTGWTVQYRNRNTTPDMDELEETHEEEEELRELPPHTEPAEELLLTDPIQGHVDFESWDLDPLEEEEISTEQESETPSGAELEDISKEVTQSQDGRRTRRRTRKPIRFQDFVAAYKVRFPDFTTILYSSNDTKDRDEFGIDVFELLDDFYLANLYCDDFDSDLSEQNDPEEVISDSTDM